MSESEVVATVSDDLEYTFSNFDAVEPWAYYFAVAEEIEREGGDLRHAGWYYDFGNELFNDWLRENQPPPNIDPGEVEHWRLVAESLRAIEVDDQPMTQQEWDDYIGDGE